MSAFFDRLYQTASVYTRWGKKTVTHKIGQARLRRFFQRHRGPVAVRFHSPGNGLFAHLNWCLKTVQWAQHEKRTVVVRCSSPQYSSGPENTDWLGTLVRQTGVGTPPADLPEIVVPDYEQLPFFTEPFPETIEATRALFRSQFSLAEDIATALRKNTAALFGESFPIGLHYRGTDKSVEAPRVPAEVAIESARRALQAARAAGEREPVLFVASDEQAFVTEIKTRLSGERVVCLDGALRSAAGSALHKAGISAGARLAQEAMLDCLLLGQCRVLIKTASMLSAWSLILGETSRVVMLSQPFAHCVFFPDNLAVNVGAKPGNEEAAVREALAASRS